MVLQALPAKYCQLKVSYNTQGNLWTLDELIAQCVQEEKRLKQDKGKEIEAVNLVHASKGKSKKGGRINPSKNSKSYDNVSKSSMPAKYVESSKKYDNLKVKIKDITKLKCVFCKTKGHIRKDCEAFKDWLRSKGNTDVYVCEESNLVEIPAKSWWFDTGASVHVTNALHGFEKQKQTNKMNYSVFVGEGTKVAVEAIGKVKLKLSSSFIVELNDVLFVPTMRRYT
ncbi:hypothetical protein C1H46_020763 [Malus baccata]|uniref:Retrovirus-related Pol polyprotein from transposon TNT 1-94-like beta-barrel domain-containing protein n=1 Tax=Malus baccata TaxID=106549 RepID=A0A540M4H8_MALBA|nr:hypothetical protein C1H46_020763 [Malus baccata]